MWIMTAENDKQDDILLHYWCPDNHKSRISELNPKYMPNEHQSPAVFYHSFLSVMTDLDPEFLPVFALRSWKMASSYKSSFFIYSIFSHSNYLPHDVSVQMNHKHPCEFCTFDPGLITAAHPICVGKKNTCIHFCLFFFLSMLKQSHGTYTD